MPTASTPPAWLLLDEFDFHHRLPALPGVSLVLFGQPGCGACRVWRAQLPGWAPPLIRQLCYVDVQVSTALAMEFEIFHLPTLLLFRDGVYHATVHCGPGQPALQQAVAQLLSQAAQEAP